MTDYGQIGTAVAVAFLGFMSVWNRRQASKIAKTVDTVHGLVNSQMTTTKRALAEVSAAKAAITKDPKDIASAKAAMNEYLAHVQQPPPKAP